MKIERTTTADLNEKEVDLFITALARLNGIGNWAKEHEKELSESSKPMANEAYKACSALEYFLQWMCVDVDGLLLDYDATDKKNFPDE